MNNNIKISLTIALPGGTMYSKQECLGNSKLLDLNTLKVEDAKGKNQETLSYYTRSSIPVQQHLNITVEAYQNMIKECPKECKQHSWRNFNHIQKIEYSLNNIAETIGGKVLSYHIFEE